MSKANKKPAPAPQKRTTTDNTQAILDVRLIKLILSPLFSFNYLFLMLKLYVFCKLGEGIACKSQNCFERFEK